jgi:hypothetical protein
MKGEVEKICCTNRERAEQGKNLLLAMSLRLLARLRQSLQSVSFVPNIEACRMDMRRSARAKRMVFSKPIGTGLQQSIRSLRDKQSESVRQRSAG